MMGVVYISGYGRSGSTLLDVLLGNLPGVVSLGEVGSLSRRWARGERCACGATLDTCPFWSAVVARLPGGTADLAELGKLIATHESWWRTSGVGTDGMRYLELTRELLEACATESGARWLVDSSKTTYGHARRPAQLMALRDLELRALHLVRQAADVGAAARKGRNSDLASERAEPWWRWRTGIAMVGWVIANRRARWVTSRLGAVGARTLRFESLLAAPEQTVRDLATWLGVDPGPVSTALQAGAALPVGHLVGGNRWARDGGLRLRAPRESGPAPAWFDRLAVELARRADAESAGEGG
jgi:hypothetical protein